MLVRIREVEPLEGLRARLTLTDGRILERDLEPLLRGPIFEPLCVDPELFWQVRVEAGGLAWPNGADLCPDAVLWGGLPPNEEQDAREASP